MSGVERPIRRATLRSSERLCGGAVGAVLRGGERWDGRLLRVVWRAGAAGTDRAGFVVPRSSGSAVQRNRVRRWLREVFRTNKVAGPEFRDIVLIARNGGRLGKSELEGEYRRWLAVSVHG